MTIHPSIPEMIRIPAGEFLMGSDPEKDKLAQKWEQPQHSLYLPEYHLAKTPVINAQYLNFVQATDKEPPFHWKGGKPPSGKEYHPVVNVSWYDATDYCRWLSEITDKPHRLPSESEWEKGARGTDGRIYSWGDEWDASRCNTWEAGPKDTTGVGTYRQGASPYGLLDMAGNVWEWTISLWGADWEVPDFKYPYNPADGRENLEAGGNVQRMLRGGSWFSIQWFARCAGRIRSNPDNWNYGIGFRVVVASTSSR